MEVHELFALKEDFVEAFQECLFASRIDGRKIVYSENTGWSP